MKIITLLFIVCYAFAQSKLQAQEITKTSEVNYEIEYFSYLKDGKPLNNSSYEIAGDFLGGYAAAYKYYNWEIINSNGKTVLRDLDLAVVIDGGYAIVKKDLQWRLYNLNKMQEVDVNLKYSVYDALLKQASKSYTLESDIIVPAEKQGKVGLVNLTGEVILNYTYDLLLNVGMLTNGEDAYFLTTNKKGLAYVNSKGKVMSKIPKYELIGATEESVLFKKDSKLYYLDSDGTEGNLVDVDFLRSHAPIRALNDKLLLVDSSSLSYKEVPFISAQQLQTYSSDKHRKVFDGKLYGLINETYEFSIPCEYKSLENVSSGDYKVKFYLGYDGANYDLYGKFENDNDYKKLNEKKYSTPYYQDQSWRQNRVIGLIGDEGEMFILKDGRMVVDNFNGKTHVKCNGEEGCHLVKSGEKVTKKSYPLIKEIEEDDMFVTVNADGTKTYISTGGKELYTGVVTTFMHFTLSPGVFLVNNAEEEIGIFSSDGKINIPMMEFQGGMNYFNWDADVYEAVKEAYIVVKGEKCGLIKINGEMAMPFEYDELYEFTTQGELKSDMLVGRKGEVWVVLNSKGETVKTIDIDMWIGKPGDEWSRAKSGAGHYTALKDNKPVFINDKLELVPATSFEQVINVFGVNEISGVIGGDGTILLPFQKQTVRSNSQSYLEIFNVERDGKIAYFDRSFNQLTDFGYDDIQSLSCNSENKKMYALYKGKLGALAVLKDNKLIPITGFDYKEFRCIWAGEKQDDKWSYSAFKGDKKVVLDIEGKEGVYRK